jgi:hypothetical protein
MFKQRRNRWRMILGVDSLESRELLSLLHVGHHGPALHRRVAAVGSATHHRASAVAQPHTKFTGLKLATAPAVAGSVLNGVAAIASNDVWAVGGVGDPYNNGTTLIEHFDGAKWSVTPSSVIAGGLFGVAGVASNDVWAVGFTIPQASLFAQALIEHWDGSQWSLFANPVAPVGSQLYGVTAIAANNVWAVGVFGPGNTELVEHFDGAEWHIVTSPAFMANGGLQSVSASSSTDVWAVGEMHWRGVDGFNPAPEALHFDGNSWTRAALPKPASAPLGSGLLSVTAVAPDNVWAVGFGTTGKDPRILGTTLIEHFNGTSWSIVTSPVPPGGSLAGVAAVSANDIWAVGSIMGTNNVDRTLTLHFDGTSWSVIASPNATPGGNELFGVTILGGGTVAAVGSAASSPSFGSNVNGLILQS